MKNLYAVMCIGENWDYTVATHRLFASEDEALEYATTICESREPVVVYDRSFQFRVPDGELDNLRSENKNLRNENESLRSNNSALKEVLSTM